MSISATCWYLSIITWHCSIFHISICLQYCSIAIFPCYRIFIYIWWINCCISRISCYVRNFRTPSWERIGILSCCRSSWISWYIYRISIMITSTCYKTSIPIIKCYCILNICWYINSCICFIFCYFCTWCWAPSWELICIRIICRSCWSWLNFQIIIIMIYLS